MSFTTGTVLDRLCNLKAQGVSFDAAWEFSTGGNRRAYFHPTERDDGTQLPADDEPIEPYARFLYRVARAAYLDLPGCGSLTDVRDLSDRDDRPRARRVRKGAVAA